jgi:hypothetical protein
MFFFTVVANTTGSCSTEAIDPFFMILPLQKGTSANIEDKRADFPLPTFPIIP